jgi:hypothetical protein
MTGAAAAAVEDPSEALDSVGALFWFARNGGVSRQGKKVSRKLLRP